MKFRKIQHRWKNLDEIIFIKNNNNSSKEEKIRLHNILNLFFTIWGIMAWKYIC